MNISTEDVEKIQKFVHKKIKCYEDAEEVCQDILVRIWQGDFDESKSNGTPYAWIWTIAKNVISSYYKRNNKKKIELDNVLVQLRRYSYHKTKVESDIECQELLQIIFDLLCRVQKRDSGLARQMQAMTLFLHGYSYREIGQELNCTPQASKNLVTRCRKHLIRYLKKYL